MSVDVKVRKIMKLMMPWHWPRFARRGLESSQREVVEGTTQPQVPAPIIRPATALPKVLVICDSHEDTDRSRGPSVLHHILIGSLKASGVVDRPALLERELMFEIGVSAWLRGLEHACAEWGLNLIVFHFPFQWIAEVAEGLAHLRSTYAIPVLGFPTDLKSAATIYQG